MWVSLAADGIIAILLGVTIFYCFLVNRKLQALRSGKDELKGVIEGLAVATSNAQASIEQLKHAGRDVIGNLDHGVREGRSLVDELALMIEAGNNLADRLEGGRQSKASGANPAGPAAQGRGTAAAGKDAQSTGAAKAPAKAQKGVEGSLENELLKALRQAR